MSDWLAILEGGPLDGESYDLDCIWPRVQIPFRLTLDAPLEVLTYRRLGRVDPAVRAQRYTYADRRFIPPADLDDDLLSAWHEWARRWIEER